MKHTYFLIAVIFRIPGCKQAEIPEIIRSDNVVNQIDSRLFGEFLEKCSWGNEIVGDLVIRPTFSKHVLTGDKSERVRNESLKQIATIKDVKGSIKGRNKIIEVPAASVSVFEFDIR